MTQIELKIKIENTREDLNAAIAGNMTRSRILDISQLLDGLIEEYLEKRDELRRVFMLIDFRIKPTEDDLLMYNFLKYYNIPVTIVATKVDKVGSSKKEKNKKMILDTFDLVMGDDLVLFSSVTKLGRDEILKKIDEIAIDSI